MTRTSQLSISKPKRSTKHGIAPRTESPNRHRETVFDNIGRGHSTPALYAVHQLLVCIPIAMPVLPLPIYPGNYSPICTPPLPTPFFPNPNALFSASLFSFSLFSYSSLSTSVASSLTDAEEASVSSSLPDAEVENERRLALSLMLERAARMLGLEDFPFSDADAFSPSWATCSSVCAGSVACARSMAWPCPRSWARWKMLSLRHLIRCGRHQQSPGVNSGGDVAGAAWVEVQKFGERRGSDVFDGQDGGVSASSVVTCRSCCLGRICIGRNYPVEVRTRSCRDLFVEGSEGGKPTAGIKCGLRNCRQLMVSRLQRVRS
ncbi:uncharacterized protein CC84DRAFT_417516 [Paraphaeosphaeria sporulosa]|uniref:Uncharacterized protein n=1 Tax=Paraphaeosphaeria sporulosa TaxID=1460663 RepID=A0A177BX87_9PLEO|nr:uncharacterized protein CC84DRAFT_417516 [Paraphaeosphaeria sporulosa]OAF99127.1 hypothetical protein CC84DRAFT_417516 [Paraphaeosphaeria sporulosa]